MNKGPTKVKKNMMILFKLWLSPSDKYLLNVCYVPGAMLGVKRNKYRWINTPRNYSLSGEINTHAADKQNYVRKFL